MYTLYICFYFCLCFCTLTKIYCLSLDSGSAYMQAVITYITYMQNRNTFRRHTNTSCCRTQIHFTGTDKYSIHAPRQLCLLQRNWNSCLRLSVFFIKLVSRFLFEPLDAMQKFKLDLSKDFAQDDKTPHFGRFCGVCSARVCFCLPYVARGASSGLVWRSPPRR